MKVLNLPGFFLAVFSFVAPEAQALPSPSSTIERAADEIRQVLKSNRTSESKKKSCASSVARVFARMMDFDSLTQKAMGPHWSKRNDREKKDFVNLFRQLLEESYSHSLCLCSELKISISEPNMDEDKKQASVFVQGRARNQQGEWLDEDEQIRFFFHADQGVWLAFDIQIGSISLLRHYRAEFNRKIKRESYQALFTAMRNRLKEIQQG